MLHWDFKQNFECLELGSKLEETKVLVLFGFWGNLTKEVEGSDNVGFSLRVTLDEFGGIKGETVDEFDFVDAVTGIFGVVSSIGDSNKTSISLLQVSVRVKLVGIINEFWDSESIGTVSLDDTMVVGEVVDVVTKVFEFDACLLFGSSVSLSPLSEDSSSV